MTTNIYIITNIIYSSKNISIKRCDDEWDQPRAETVAWCRENVKASFGGAMPGMQCNIFLPHHHASAYLSSFNPSSFHNHYTTNNHNTPIQIWAFLSLFGVQIHLFLKGKEGSISSQFENLFSPLIACYWEKFQDRKMSAVSGVISRKVLPACGTLCFFCPSLRARSRQPVKRYKKLIADIFPRNHQVYCFHYSLIFIFLMSKVVPI